MIKIQQIKNYLKKKIYYDNIKIKYNDRFLNKRIYSQDIKASAVVIIFNLPKNIKNNSYIDIKILYNSPYHNINKNMKLVYKNFKKKYNFCVNTLFKDDIYLFDNWINYYNEQGVDYFFLYCNKKLTPKIINTCKKYTNVLLIQWDYHWMIHPKLGRMEHHAQLGQIAHTPFKYGKPLSKWMMNIDSDEYLYTSKISLNKYLKINSRFDIIYFFNHFSRIKDSKIPHHNIYNMKKINVYALKNNTGMDRVKYIYKTNKLISNTIHWHMTYDNINIKLNVIKKNKNKIFHFENWGKYYDYIGRKKVKNWFIVNKDKIYVQKGLTF